MPLAPQRVPPHVSIPGKPYLQSLSEGVIASHTLKLFGIGESAMEAQPGIR